MTEQLKETIQNFLVDFDNTYDDDSFGLADYSLWLDTAVDLLQQVIDNQ